MGRRRKVNSRRPGSSGWLRQLGSAPAVVQLDRRDGTGTMGISDTMQAAITAHLQRVIVGIETGRIPRCPHVWPGTPEPFMASALTAYCHDCPPEVMLSLMRSRHEDRTCDACRRWVDFPGRFSTAISTVGTLALLTTICEDCAPSPDNQLMIWM